MESSWLSRLFFAGVAAVGVAVLASGTACTRWGQPGPATPSLAPVSTLYVDPSTGSDTTGNGSMNAPYKTLTKAVNVVINAKSLSPSGVMILLASGDYTKTNGEIFPIVIPKSVTITGSNFGSIHNGTFIDGYGEDTIFEKLVHAPVHSAYATLEVTAGADVGASGVYVGAAKIAIGASAGYAAVDDMGSFTGSISSFGAGIVSTQPNIGGILVPGGTLTCSSCQIRGNGFGISAFAAPIPTTSPPSGVGPSVSLSQSTGDNTIAARMVDIVTDGAVNVTASDERFERGLYAFSDSLKPLVLASTPGAIDFGGGAAASSGGNNFIGARRTEINITRRDETVTALDDTWNPNQQGASPSGLYKRKHVFASNAAGKNVTVAKDAVGSTVTVGPAPAPSPTPSITPSTSPTPT